LYPGVPVPAPAGFLPWTAAVLSSLSAGYLEESYFRWYLPARFREAGISAVLSFSVSTLLFALCHVYEGPWGFANALLAGALLSFLFVKGRSFHSIALAHGLYNVLVYALSAVTE
jgi:membrane protease YdiL (CAAX protease family)